MMQPLPPLTGHPAILKAIKLIGSENRLAAALGTSRGSVYNIRTGRRRASAAMAIRLEAVTNRKVRRHDVRPDLW